MGYDVFISYSQAGDRLMAERVQNGLTRFAKPWWRRRALSVFRDETGLTANPGLWSSIADAIDSSRFFLLLASPEAAGSPWVTREITQWRAKHGSEGMLILLTDGNIVWGESASDFDWAATTALSATALADTFAEAPRYVDMRWARTDTQLDLNNGRFRDQIAEIAAPVHGVPKDQIATLEVREHRRTIRQVIAAGTALVMLTLASIALTAFAISSRASAIAAKQAAQKSAHAAELARTYVVRQQRIAERQRSAAVHQRRIAQRQKAVAIQLSKIANRQSLIAFFTGLTAQANAANAEQQAQLTAQQAQLADLARHA